MELRKFLTTTVFTGLLITGLSACEKGPAEKAGETIDDAASDVADKTGDVVDSVKDKMNQ